MGTSQFNSIDDLFESSLNLEDSHINEGFKQGYEDGYSMGRDDARVLGLKIGFETGELLGFYKGCADIWLSAIRVDPSHFSGQLQKHVKEFHDMILKYPISNPEDESVDMIKNDLRIKFGIICGSLGVGKKLEYRGYPKTSNDLEF